MFILKGIIYLIISIILFNIFLSIHNHNKVYKKAKKVIAIVKNNHKIPNGEDDYKPVYYTEYEVNYNGEIKTCMEYTNSESQIGLKTEKLLLEENGKYHIFDKSIKKENKVLFLIFSILFFAIAVSCFSNPFKLDIANTTNYFSSIIIGILLIILSFKELTKYNKLNNAVKNELLSTDAEIVDYAAHCDDKNNYLYAPIYKCKLYNKTRLITDNNFKQDIKNKKGEIVTIYINPKTNFIFEEEEIKKHKTMTFTYFIIGTLFIILTII